MLSYRSKSGWQVIGLALALFACEVESTFTPNDTAESQEDVLGNPDGGSASIDAVETDVQGLCEASCGKSEECIGDSCVPTYCPPQGPFGVMPGETLTDVVVKDCDGNDVHIHELCGANAAFFNLLAGW